MCGKRGGGGEEEEGLRKKRQRKTLHIVVLYTFKAREVLRVFFAYMHTPYTVVTVSHIC